MFCSFPVGAPSAPVNVMTTAGTTSISITWQQAEGDVVDRYEIQYTYTVNAHPGSCVLSDTEPITVTVNNGTARGYNLTPVEEDSVYTLSLTAINSAGSTSVSVSPSPITQQAGEIESTWYTILLYPVIYTTQKFIFWPKRPF